MRIFTEQALREYAEEHPDSKVALQEWVTIVKKSEWACFADIKKTFNSADSVGNQHYVFNVKGNNYRLVVVVKFTVKFENMTKIENQTQYEWAVKRVEDLLPLVKDDTPLNDPNSIELELLSNLVADYSEEHFSLGEPSLVDVLKLRMYEMGLNQKSLSQLIGVSPSRLSDYISGKCEPTLKVAREISKKLNIDASIVLGV